MTGRRQGNVFCRHSGSRSAACPTALMVILAGACMTASAYFGIRGLEIVSYVSVPVITILGFYSVVTAITAGGGLEAVFAKDTQGISVLAGSGLVIGSFVSGGTTTPNFVRFASTRKAAVTSTVIAFFAGNTLYSAGLGFSNLTKIRKKPMVLASGAAGTILAVWIYHNFIGWLSFLNATLPPVGMIIILDYFLNRKSYKEEKYEECDVNWGSLAGLIAGAAVGNLAPFGVSGVNAMVCAAVCYCIYWRVKRGKRS